MHSAKVQYSDARRYTETMSKREQGRAYSVRNTKTGRFMQLGGGSPYQPDLDARAHWANSPHYWLSTSQLELHFRKFRAHYDHNLKMTLMTLPGHWEVLVYDLKETGKGALPEWDPKDRAKCMGARR